MNILTVTEKELWEKYENGTSLSDMKWELVNHFVEVSGMLGPADRENVGEKLLKFMEDFDTYVNDPLQWALLTRKVEVEKNAIPK